MKKLVISLILSAALISCGEKKSSNESIYYKEAVNHAKDVQERVHYEHFLKDYEAFSPILKDSVLTLDIGETRKGTDLSQIAKETFDKAKAHNVPIKSCVVIDSKRNLVGKYEE